MGNRTFELFQDNKTFAEHLKFLILIKYPCNIQFNLEQGLTLAKINLSHRRQPTDHYCVPACAKMVLDYMCNHFNVKCKALSIKTIAKTTKTNKDGTAPRAIENVNFLLHRAKPPMKFQLFEMARFPEIVDELNEERPVIVWINIAELPDEVWHAVVITGFNPEDNVVTYDDPDEDERNCEKNLEAGVFTRKWGFQARLIKVLIGTKGQTYIDGEWATEGVSE